MKIGIFGDSFASIPHSRHNYKNVWYNLLAKKLNGVVYNCELNSMHLGYGRGGSSTYWSYKKFLKYYQHYDFIIFHASDAVRYTKYVDIYENNNPVTLHGLNCIEHYLNDKKLPAKSIDLLNDVKTWYLMNDDKFMYDLQELLLADVERKTNGKVLILSAIREAAFTIERIKNSPVKFGLWDFTRILHKSTGIETFPNHCDYENPLTIINHMTLEGNKYLADMLYECIVNGKTIELPTFIEHAHSHEYYWNIPK